jgi:hypothetical protein
MNVGPQLMLGTSMDALTRTALISVLCAHRSEFAPSVRTFTVLKSSEFSRCYVGHLQNFPNLLSKPLLYA